MTGARLPDCVITRSGMVMTCMSNDPERFTDQLRAAADPIWSAQHAHPFVRGIGDGTLDVARFSYFVRQDYLFLIDYARLLALGAARAPDLTTMRRFAALAQAILVDEMDLHRSYAAEFGISTADLEAEPMTPTTQGYTDFLVRTASHGDFAELAAALLPCMWGYAEVGQRLAQDGRPAEPRYARWIDMYADEEFSALAAWCRELVDRLGTEASAALRAPMTRAFITSSRYELAFWQAAWDRAGWPP
jgi:thiaminase (transcriptional activator TenA)